MLIHYWNVALTDPARAVHEWRPEPGSSFIRGECCNDKGRSPGGPPKGASRAQLIHAMSGGTAWLLIRVLHQPRLAHSRGDPGTVLINTECCDALSLAHSRGDPSACSSSSGSRSRGLTCPRIAVYMPASCGVLLNSVRSHGRYRALIRCASHGFLHVCRKVSIMRSVATLCTALRGVTKHSSDVHAWCVNSFP
jgi:hypothetical protein